MKKQKRQKKKSKDKILGVAMMLVRMVVLIYVGLAVVLVVMQKRYIYYPNDQDFYNCLEFEEYEKVLIQGETRGYFLENGPKVLVYFHGNAGSACDRAFLKLDFSSLGYSVLFVEYAGYSGDSRSPSKELLLADAVNVAEFIEDGKFDEVMVVGASLGSGVASFITTQTQVDKLVLVAAFNSTADVAQSLYRVYPVKLLMTENYDSQGWLANYEGEVLLVHGADDRTISPVFSQKLAENLAGVRVKRVVLDGFDHLGMLGSAEFYNLLEEFLVESS